MSAYYNEHDPKAAAWLRELILAGLIADGDVDGRSIVDIQPGELAGYTQCHFFAGIGGWSYALRLAGWADDRPVWTGSCPCQPFSSAGANRGTDDPRHLWPAWFRLIRECRPSVVFGEQVEAAIGHGWLDLVCDDLEGEGYAVGTVGLPAACVGAPHIRQRLWFVAEPNGWDAKYGELQRGWQHGFRAQSGRADGDAGDAERAEAGELADALLAGRPTRWPSARPGSPTSGGSVDGLGHADGGQRGQRIPTAEHASPVSVAVASRTNAWADLVWLPCRDGKARPTQPGLQPLAHGVSARVGRLRGYGNAIVPAVAAEVIKAYREAIGENLHGM